MIALHSENKPQMRIKSTWRFFFKTRKKKKRKKEEHNNGEA